MPYPNSLWHIDGYHKLIKWRIVIHGAIDGYSRLPVYIVASDNNKATTVLSVFQEAVRKYGFPSRYVQIKVERMCWYHFSCWKSGVLVGVV